MEFASSHQTIAWLRQRYVEGSLIIKPPFQRKPVWGARQKCYLIESILLHLPVPEIYIQQTTTTDGQTTYAVVDGQQRVRTILQFLGSEIDPAEQDSNGFVLDKLADTSPYKDDSFEDLSAGERAKFFEYDLAVRMLKTNDDYAVRDLFARLNKYLSPLKAQELRNATYVGPFMQLSKRLADDDYWITSRIVSAAMIRRMKDVEFVSELVIGILDGPQGGSAAVIDAYYANYEDFELEFPEERRAKELFADTIRVIQLVFPALQETSRWRNVTDFYTLFVGIGTMLREHTLPATGVRRLRVALLDFEAKVDRRLADQHAKVPKYVVQYARAVEKGANDKKRRGDRHLVMLSLVEGHFKLKKT